MLKDMEAMKGELTALAKIFEFHGYQRAGFGVNSKGGQQGAFKLPGARAKYRLGNEAEMYGEWELDANWINPDHDGAWFKTAFMFALVTGRNGSFDAVPTGNTGVRQAYVEAGKLIDSQPDLTFWGGQRYYRRRDIHINDFFYQNTSSFGGGFYDLDVGFGKLAIAYLGGSSDAAVFDLGKLTRSLVDIRLYGIPIGSHTLEFWLLPTIGAERPDNSDIPQSGIAGGVFFLSPHLLGGFNEASIQFGFAGASDLGSDTGGGGLSTANKSGWKLRFVDRAAVQLTPTISIMWDGIFELDNADGDACGGVVSATTCSRGNIWASFGARPVFMLSKYFGFEVEGGLDITQSEVSGAPTLWLAKVTGAAIIRTGSGFFSRPELRLFVTGAFWADDAKCAATDSKGCVGGAVGDLSGGGGNPFAGDTAGATFGIQAESWW